MAAAAEEAPLGGAGAAASSSFSAAGAGSPSPPASPSRVTSRAPLVARQKTTTAGGAAPIALPVPANRLSLAERHAMERAEADRQIQNSDITSPLRVWVFQRVTSQKWFENAVLAVIFLNCITLAMANPAQPVDDPVIQFTEAAEIFFAVVFTAEMLLKWTALGLFCEHGYFRDSWNVLDFIIVVSGYLTFVPGVSNFTSIRLLRILRPLRAVNNMPGLRVIVRTLLQSVKALGDVAVLLLFLFVIYGIIGVQLWSGNLRQQCFEPDDAAFKDPLGAFCSTGPSGFQCSNGTVCAAKAPAPNAGLTGFDNIAQATLTVFTTSTLSDWSTVMFSVMDTSSDYSSLYFISVVLVASYFAMNLVLAVVSDVFGGLSSETKEEARAEERERRDAKMRLRRRESILKTRKSLLALQPVSPGPAGSPPLSPSPHSPEAAPGVSQVGSSSTAAPSAVAMVPVGAGAGVDVGGDAILALPAITEEDDPAPPRRVRAAAAGAGSADGDDEKTAAAAATASAAGARSSPDASDDESASGNGLRRASTWSLGSVPPGLLSPDLDDEQVIAAIEEHERAVQARVLRALEKSLDERQAEVRTRERRDSAIVPPVLDRAELLARVAPVLDAARLEFDLQMTYLATHPRWFRTVYDWVQWPWFSRVVLCMIVANTVTLAMEHHGMSESLRDNLDTANAVFTLGFFVEMVLKLVALGPSGYARDAFNLFDGFIVCVSMVEFVAFSGGALSVLRTFRLLRILRLAKSQKSLRILLDTVVGSLGSVGYMTLVLVLFMYIFAVLGMQLFAGKWDNIAEDDRPRSSFDNFFWAFVTVFQMTTGDDWTGLMTAGVRASGTQAALLYFVVTTVFGIFIVLNLFVAILLENFGEQDDEHFEEQDLEEPAERLARVEAGYDEAEALRELARLLAESRLAAFEEERAKEEALRQSRLPSRMEGRSFGLFSRDSRARRFCWGLVHTWQFQYFIVLAILVNCVLLAMENPGVDESSGLGRALAATDVVFVCVFTAEMVIKLVAMGVYQNPRAYFRDNWNSLDAFVVVTGLLSLALPSLAVVRSFRALRPLRVVVRSEQIRVVVTSLYRALPAIFNVALFCLIFWAIFGILGVSLFGGLFYSCQEDASLDRAPCEAAGLSWRNTEQHFDHLGASMLTLFQVASLSGWNDIMYQAIDATTVDKAPREDAQPQAALFFLLFIVVGSFFSLNLLLGVVVDNFNRLKAEFDGSAFLTEEQRHWVATRKLLRLVKLDARVGAPRGSLLRAPCYAVVTHPWFDPVINAAIVLNVVVMMTEYFEQPEALGDAQYWLNFIFAVVFALEAVLKIGAYTFPVYWKDDWNKFDFFLVLLSIGGLAFDAGVGASVLRVFRIGRILRLIKRAKTLKQMFETLLLSLPALWNIAFLLFVIFFIFAVLGVEFFGAIRIDDDTGINRDTNFKDFGHAMLTLYVLAAGDKWEEVMFGARNTANGGTSLAPLYFVTFMVVGAMVMVELYVAVILENFGNAAEEADDSTKTNLEKMDAFKKAWGTFDPLATNALPAAKFEELMAAAPPPFGFGEVLSRFEMLGRLRRVAVPIRRRAARGHGARGYLWYAEFRPTLERVAQALTLGEGAESLHPADNADEVTVEDVWDCSACTRRCWKLREDVTQATMAEWYAVQTLENVWLARRAKRPGAGGKGAKAAPAPESPRSEPSRVFEV